MKTYEFYTRLGHVLFLNPDMRKGQAAFNLMMEVNPKMAERYRGSPFDPFYRDDRMKTFVELCLKEG
jgi:hypothetical protein